MDEDFALKISDVQEIIPIETITPIPRAPSYIAGIINFRGSILTVLDTEKRVFDTDRPNPQNQKYIIIISIESNLMGFIVGNVEGIVKVEVVNETTNKKSSLTQNKFKKNFLDSIIKWKDNATENIGLLLNIISIATPSTI